ncbi:hypothetical protein [Vulgatibacter sp.]|uniref:hypothetical protein n=1 Tax=Vulgatibacter sp. TaxID=1971226 RepID=UPI00356298E1
MTRTTLLLATLLLAPNLGCGDDCEEDCDCVGYEDDAPRPGCSGEYRCVENSCVWRCTFSSPAECADDETWVEQQGCSVLASCE